MDTCIFFHNDIDGIVTAAGHHSIVSGRVECRNWDDGDIILRPFRSSHRGPIFQKSAKATASRLNTNVVVVDYEYSPHASLWIDHHHSEKFGSVPISTAQIEYNPHALSAARVYYNRLISSRGHIVTPLPGIDIEKLIDSVDIIDNAGYTDIKEFFEGTSPIMCLSAYLETEFPSSMMFCRIVEMLSSKMMDMRRSMKCLEIDDQYVTNLQNKAKSASKLMVSYQNFSIIEQHRANQFPRYSEYYSKPDLWYAIRMTRMNGGRELYIQVGANKWCGRKNEVNIGSMLSKLPYKKTGGGHFNVGGCVINAKYHERFIDDMCVNLNGDNEMNPVEEEMEKYGVSPDDPVEQKATEMVKTGEASDINDAREKAQKKPGEQPKDGATTQ